MKILVLSDTHGDMRTLRKVIDYHDDINTIIHLGDGLKDIEDIKLEYEEKNIYNICGNCDCSTEVPQTIEIEIEGRKILATHGHIFKVKKDLNELITEAKRRGASIVLYGHTHIPKVDFKDEIYIMNPGSLHSHIGSYGILKIENNEIKMKIFNI